MKKRTITTSTRTTTMTKGSHKERLHKILAEAGILSLRKAEQAIKQGRVSVNGKVVNELGALANRSDSITLDGNEVETDSKLYFLLYKPAGCVTTTEDPEGRKTVLDLIPEIKVRVFPVGRLDYNTTGALILTNDGDFSQAMLKPSSKVVKRYHAKVRGLVTEGIMKKMVSGITIEGVKYRFEAVRLVRKTGTNSVIAVDLTEGKKHHVKKLCEKLGHPVAKLARVSFGPVKLTGLDLGDYRHLSAKEVQSLLRSAKGLAPLKTEEKQEERPATKQKRGIAKGFGTRKKKSSKKVIRAGYKPASKKSAKKSGKKAGKSSARPSIKRSGGKKR